MSARQARALLTIVGARPQFIKAAAVSRRISQKRSLAESIVHTGQHFDETMSDVFFKELQIPKPKHHLEIHSLPHGAMTGRMLEALEALMLQERPAAVMVYGDTNSTLAGALAARKLNIPLVHVEAGLRSHNPSMPEEVNRILADRMSALLCCPTIGAVKNLEHEGFGNFPCRFERTGDVMQDAAMYFAERAGLESDVLERLGVTGRPFALATIHRAENTDSLVRLSSALRALDGIAERMPVVFPVHPRTAAAMRRWSIETNVRMTAPIGYLDMIQLTRHSSLVLTDSGGLQKEAFFFGKPCVTLRDETEWTELVEGGYNWLAGTAEDRILLAAEHALAAKLDFDLDLYGSGRAGQAVADLVEECVCAL